MWWRGCTEGEGHEECGVHDNLPEMMGSPEPSECEQSECSDDEEEEEESGCSECFCEYEIGRFCGNWELTLVEGYDFEGVPAIEVPPGLERSPDVSRRSLSRVAKT